MNTADAMIHKILVVGLLIHFAGSTPTVSSGNKVKIEQCPYQVSIQKSNQHICGGAIIGPEWVLTAAQCVKGSTNLLSVRVGSNNAKADGVVHKVEEVIVHDQYNAKTQANDIALVKVTPRLKIGSTIDIVKLPIDKEIVPPNLEAVLTGYGKTSASAIPTYALQSVVMPTNPESVCKASIGSININTMICAGWTTGGRDACDGDEGSPLVFNKKLIGITSWNFSCGVNSKPTVFTKISFYRAWIKKHTAL